VNPSHVACTQSPESIATVKRPAVLPTGDDDDDWRVNGINSYNKTDEYRSDELSASSELPTHSFGRGCRGQTSTERRLHCIISPDQYADRHMTSTSRTAQSTAADHPALRCPPTMLYDQRNCRRPRLDSHRPYLLNNNPSSTPTVHRLACNTCSLGSLLSPSCLRQIMSSPMERNDIWPVCPRSLFRPGNVRSLFGGSARRKGRL